ncbi:MAG: glycosyltransferase family 4 protein [Ignavibacteriaceae bacterium]
MQSWGGGEEFILKLCNYLTDFKFVIATPPGETENIFTKKKLNVFVLKSLSKIYKSENKWNLVSKIKILFKVKISSFSLISLIIKEKINLIIANGNFAALFSIIPSFFLRKKLIVIQHLIYNTNSFESKLLKFIIKFSDKFICVSNSVKQNILLIVGENYNKKLYVIYNGIELPDVELLLAEKNDDKIKIGIVGSIIRIKGIDLVIDALAEIIHQNSKVHLFIYGTPNNQNDSIEYKKGLEKQIEENSLNKNVHFMGYEKDKTKIYNNLDVVLNYSIVSEAFPFTILEAMSYKKIVIAADIGGPKEIIIDNENGFLIESGNKNKLEKKIKYVVNGFDTNEINLVKENARNTIKDKFNVNIFVQGYNEIFNSINN